MANHLKFIGLIIVSSCWGAHGFTPQNSRLAHQRHFKSLDSKRTISRTSKRVVDGASSLPFKPSVVVFGIPAGEAVPIIEIRGMLGGGALLAIYHARLFLRDRSGLRSWRSVQASTREKWSKHVRETESWLYAIQTLRNAITAQTFLATTVLSLLTVISGRLWEILKQSPSGVDRQTFIAQFISVAASMLTSAYCFLQSARLMTHAGFMFPVNPNSTQVDRIMRKSENSQWLGLRSLYISASFLSWIIGGPRIFFIVSFLLTTFFRLIDQAPKGIANEEPL